MNQGITKSPNDKNFYKTFVLENGLRVLIISDQSNLTDANTDGDLAVASEPAASEKLEDELSMDDEEIGSECSDNVNPSGDKKLAAAALCVDVGSFSDPEEFPGLAHFVEHMVFMGSEKYPDENAYDSFISTHGGYDNATTETEKTTYMMDVLPQHFKQALDIFANCFISPLFRHESMDREIEAVDSEFSMALPVDSERLNLLLQSLARNDHPMSKFSYGNQKSLKEMPLAAGTDLNKAVRDFFNKHYSSHHMTLAVQSTETLETLEEWVREIFSLLPNNNLPSPYFGDLPEPFQKEKFCRLYKVVPIEETHQLYITWALPPTQKHYRSKPLRYLGNLMGHEGRGSILSHLRKKSWAILLSAGNYESGLDYNSTLSLFHISVHLTDSGMDNIFEVITYIFQYIKMLQDKGPQECIFDELRAIANQRFLFKEPVDPVGYVSRLSENMHSYPVEEYLTGNALLFEYDAQVLGDCTNALCVEDANITIMSTRLADAGTCNEREPWSECNYTSVDIPTDWLQKFKDLELNSSFHLPEENKFIATKFDLKHTESEHKYPYKIFEDERNCVWFKEDVKFKVPKAYALFHFMSPFLYSSALNNALLDLFLQIFCQKLCDDAYAAEIANSSYLVMGTCEGFMIQINGFDHKFNLLLETILENIVKFEVDEPCFADMKETLRLMNNNYILEPNKLAKDLEGSIFHNKFWSSLDKVKALEVVTLEMLMNFVKSGFSNARIESLIQGNVTKEEAIQMHAMIMEKILVECPVEDNLDNLYCVKIPVAKTYCRVCSFNPSDMNTVVRIFYQIDEESVEAHSMIDLLVDFMMEPCFNTLRTIEQLGYSVGCKARLWCNTLGLMIEVQSQSTKFSSDHVDKRIEIFFKSFLEEMIDISDEKFQTQLDSHIELKKQVHINLKEEFDHNYTKVQRHYYQFDLKEKQVEYLEKLEKQQFVDWLQQKFCHNDKPNLKKLCIQVLGPKDELVCAIPVSNTSDGKKVLCFAPSTAEELSPNHIRDITMFKSGLDCFPNSSRKTF